MCSDTGTPNRPSCSVQLGETVACAIIKPCRNKAPRCPAATWLRRAWPIGGAVSSRSKRCSSQSVRRGLRNSVSTVTDPIPSAERCLYELLHAKDPDSAHGRYNALIRRLVSFERAAAGSHVRQPRVGPPCAK